MRIRNKRIGKFSAMILIIIAFLFSGCSFQTNAEKENKIYSFSDEIYITEDYAIQYQVPSEMKERESNGKFINEKYSLQVISICQEENILNNSSDLFNTMNSYMPINLILEKKETINSHFHLICTTEKENTFVLLTERKIATPEGKYPTGIAIIVETSTLSQNEVEQLFKYMQIYMKSTW